jgi:hypothetical protein
MLRAVGVGVTVGVAGCSGNGDDTESATQDTSTDSTETDKTTEGSATDSETQNGGTPGDVVHTGEEELESYISSVGDPEDLPDDVNGYFPVGQSEYDWIEFENPVEQIDQNFGDFENDGNYFFDRGGLDSVDTLYLALTEISDGYDTAWVGLDSDAWEEGEPAAGNSGKSELSTIEVSDGSMESFLSGNISSYDDVSDGISQDHLDLIGE